MTQTTSFVLEFDSAVEFIENSSLVFVDDAEYEFIGGGAAVTNGL